MMKRQIRSGFGRSTRALLIWKVLKRSFLVGIIGLVLVFTVQGLLFAYLVSGKPKLEPADLIVAFEGRRGRAETAYRLVDRGLAPALVISPANKHKLNVYDLRFKPKRKVEKIIENKARTTFENALYSGRIVEDNHFKTIILVTSWNHMPRSYLLLKLVLIGADTRIQLYPVATGLLNRNNWYRHTLGLKMIYNEILESWGSIAELVVYRYSGKISDRRIGRKGFIRFLRNILLFEIDPVAMASYSF
jgi:uncharacterized SAM-binding protein YcdF (DUF218 family)